MDNSHAMLNIFGNPTDMSMPASPPPDDDSFLYLFSSPATQAEESSLQKGFPSPPVTTQAQFLSNTQTPDAISQLDSFMVTTSSSQQLQQLTNLLPGSGQRMSAPPAPEPAKDDMPSKRPKAEPSPVPATTASSDSDSVPGTNGSAPRKGFSRLGGKKRPLSAMQSVAKRNAPNVTLSDQELLEISEMHESEQSLAESRELFSGIVAFKRCLAKYGYRMKSLYVDSIPAEEGHEVDGTPFAFVLNKKQQLHPNNSEKSDQSGSPDAQGQESATHRSSVTMTTSDVTAQHEKDAGPEASERPKKRARISEKADSSNDGQHRMSCTVCCKKMSDFGNLVRHFRHAHQEMKPFMCPKCKGFYSSEGTLWHHLNNVHSESRRIHKCEYCDASYDSSGAKTRHVHGTHHTERPLYVCSFPDCQRTFIFPAHLENHANLEHKGFRPFQCEECSKTFSSANGLVRHCREVHRKEKAYTCPVCETGLTKRCHLKRHLLNVHHLPLEIVDVEMKRHPNPGDIPVLQPSSSNG